MRRRHRDEDGSAVIEFALIFPIFAAIVMGIIQFGWYFFTAESTNTAAREVARRVVVGDCWGGQDDLATDFAPQMTGSVGLSTAPSGLSVGDNITVTVTSDAELLSLIPGVPATVTRAYTAHMEVDEQSDAADDACLAP
ncbi:pilus assembly protein [Nocardioides guangzhouensis]|uniref:Pilus assembly protein n=1 Tax=Nocardioides guangzhouensis TaxID=2497878 RepID=A0A4Q4ZCB1_9ACTN|nr:TadE/TadG family type IV pilus assembly protein [Nocardioides guangzhouensis]RYP85680.1 pilus assembly protein [Nocardioides guangzhouensis]